MKVQRRKVLRVEEVPAFVERADGTGGLELVKSPVYEACPESAKLRKLRRELRMTLQRAADALGCGIVQVGELERGVSEPVAPHTWDEALRAYEKAGRQP